MNYKFEYLNWLTSKSRETCDPTKKLSMSASEKIAHANNETFKQNNGKYPDRLYK